jgi:hypothetical protein
VKGVKRDLTAEFPEIFYAMAHGAPINYGPAFREFSTSLGDGGSSMVFENCPFTGKTLPASLRDDWFDAIGALKLFPEDEVFDWNDERIPPGFRTDAWWNKEE